MELTSIFSLLNNQQQTAIEETEGYIRVIAGAGSGKTKTLTQRYLYLVTQIGVEPSNLLCVTFTNKAANEMKKRIRQVIGDGDLGYISTFHGLCVQILKEDIHTVSFPSHFIVIDREDVKDMLQRIFIELELSSKDYNFSKIMNMICDRKCSLAYLEDFLALDLEQLRTKFLTSTHNEDKIFFRYLYEQRKNYGLDFDDLIIFVLHIFKQFPNVALKWQEKLEYIMVDEFQDIDGLQYELVSILSQVHGNLFVVGDPDQTVYSWRGANVKYILEFDQQFPHVQTIFLNQNYRSNPSILNVSNSLIQKNKQRLEKQLIPTKETPTPVYYYHGQSAKQEVDWVIDEIQKLHEKGVSYHEIAILYRSHFYSRGFEEHLTQSEIPYTLFNGVEFYKRKEIKDILCYLRMLVYQDDLSFLRIINTPKRNIGEKRLAVLQAEAFDHNISLYDALQLNLETPLFKSTEAADFIQLIYQYTNTYKDLKLSELFSLLLNQSGYEAMLRSSGDQDRLDNLAELKQSLYEYENNAGEDYSLSDYLTKIALYTDSEKTATSSSIKMMTVHTAKGLEFPYVFVCGLSEGIFPSKKTNTAEKMEEERRLAYVAYTRAMEQLYLSDAQGVNYDNSFRYPSRFIFNIDKPLLTYVHELDEHLVSEATNYIAYTEGRLNVILTDLQVGDAVKHSILGVGSVVEAISGEPRCKVQFESLKTTRTIRTNLLEKLS
ncbi:MAG TPA: DNA helicase UvrD [Firmicutes bacterium]|nr:DNA helicase UvrD [Bacillota bacterium]